MWNPHRPTLTEMCAPVCSDENDDKQSSISRSMYSDDDNDFNELEDAEEFPISGEKHFTVYFVLNTSNNSACRNQWSML